MGHGKPCECGLAQAPPWPWVVQGQGPGRAGGILFECHMEAEGRGPPRLDEACARRIAYCGNRLCAHTRTGTQCRSPALVGASIRDVHHTANSAAMLCKRTELLLFVAKILGDDRISRDISRSVCTLRHWSQSVLCSYALHDSIRYSGVECKKRACRLLAVHVTHLYWCRRRSCGGFRSGGRDALGTFAFFFAVHRRRDLGVQRSPVRRRQHDAVGHCGRPSKVSRAGKGDRETGREPFPV